MAWFLCGFFIALGGLVPGMSPSNFIVYLGLYGDKDKAFASFDMSAIIPIGLGGLLTVLTLAKVIEKYLKIGYSKFYHFIFGIVLASTIMIVPTDYSGFWYRPVYLVCSHVCWRGLTWCAWMEALGEKKKGKTDMIRELRNQVATLFC